MSKQNRLQMTNETTYDQETQDLILKNMVNTISNDYAEMYNSTPNPIKDVLNQLLMFGEEEINVRQIQRLHNHDFNIQCWI